jgi:hypothetical protein
MRKPLNRSVWIAVYVVSIYASIGFGVGLDQVVMRAGSGIDPFLRLLYNMILWPVFLFWTWYHHPARG